MSNKSSSVFGGKTTRWELGGNPNETMFSKPAPVAQTPPPLPETPTIVSFKSGVEEVTTAVDNPEGWETGCCQSPCYGEPEEILYVPRHNIANIRKQNDKYFLFLMDGSMIHITKESAVSLANTAKLHE